MILAGPDGALVVEDDVVEVVHWDGVVELGVGATGWIHAGVTVDVQPGAVAYLAAGADQEPVRPGDLERCDVTVTAWTPPLTPPADVSVIGGLPAHRGATNTAESPWVIRGEFTEQRDELPEGSLCVQPDGGLSWPPVVKRAPRVPLAGRGGAK